MYQIIKKKHKTLKKIVERKGLIGEGKTFANIEEVEHALEQGIVDLHSKIIARMPQIDEQGLTIYRRFDTTPGRLRIGSLLPKNHKAPFEIVTGTSH